MEKTKRISNKLIKLLLTAAMLVMMLGMTAFAAGDAYVDMTAGESGTYVYRGVWEDSQTNVYHRITVPSTGALVITGNSIWESAYSGSTYFYSMKVELYSAKMKRLEPNDYGTYVSATDSRVAVYGVKKGTYYIKVSGEDNYSLAAAVEKTTNKGGTSKKKATTISQKKTIKGVMPAGEKSTATDWYKFKVTKNKVLQIKLDTANNGMFQFWLYGPSYKNGIWIDSLENEGGTYYSINSLTKKKVKVAKGTYYIKVKRSTYDKKSSGIYSIRWALK